MVFAGPHLRAALYPGTSGTLMVTLDHWKKGRTGFLPPNHSNGYARMGHAQLSIKTRDNDWFINPDTMALEVALTPVGAGHDQVKMLGFSMGGYGALRFAKALGADQVVIISPQVTIAPHLPPFDRRYRAEAMGFDPVLGDLAPHAMPDLRGLIVIDPFMTTDLAHARLILRLFPNLSVVRTCFAGHPAHKILQAKGQAWMLQHAAAGNAVAKRQAILKAHRAERRGSPVYWDRLAASAARRRPALAAHALAMKALLATAPVDAET